MLGFPPEARDPLERPRDSSTVILLRGATAEFEVFMLRRHEQAGFMGGAYVFPGGKLDDIDRQGKVTLPLEGLHPAEAASLLAEGGSEELSIGLFVAAIRETFEEAGILLGDVEPTSSLEEARRRLDAGSSFHQVVGDLGARLRLDRLVPYARWVTPSVERRRFDTRFFLALAPEGQQGRHDGSETVADAWLRPRVALEQEERGEIFMAPPTVRTLEALCEFDSAAAALKDAASRPPPLVRPIFELRDGEPTLFFPGDPEHPDDGPRVPGPTRMVLDAGRWRPRRV